MKSPQVSTVIIALVFAGFAFFLFSLIEPTQTSVAIAIFIAAFVAPLIGFNHSSESSTSDDIKTLYVGNLPYRANEASVRELFSTIGQVHSVRLMKDKHTGKRRGFGFVEMSANDTDKAVEALNDKEFQQRTLKVREAKERPEKEAE
ncbi:RNA-binding protein [Colwellia sp. UCD-KL20]|uniref:RNA recognition motif domain-containing protein n=1 Tax=Colwellia sp. UCD-KL20 TaxID=1917165 RepID=UPI00097141D9|nr:RNA-binding protein [Colwellia sp. UCD-KL20]